MARIIYQGHLNVENGGYWIKLDKQDWKYGYLSAVRVTPCSDAGAQDNAYWIEELTVSIPDTKEELSGIVDTCGWMIMQEDGSIETRGTILKKNTSAYRLAVANACIVYGKYDIRRFETVQIGKHDMDHSDDVVQPDTILRSNASLENYVRREFVRSL